MADIREINRAITELEHKGTEWPVCNRLAVLYTVRDHMQPYEETPTKETAYSYAAGKSEFVQIASAKNYRDVLDVMDELMDCIKALYPKSYDATIRKLAEL